MSRRGLALLGFWLLATAAYQTHKALPEGIGYEGAPVAVPVGSVTFLSDLTYGAGGGRAHRQEIFDTLFSAIEGARRYVLLDMFLFNSFGPADAAPLRGLSGELTDRLAGKRLAAPEVRIDLITDPINTVYGGVRSEDLERLRSAGVNVVVTDLRALRDSNTLFSPLWRTFLQWFGNSSGGGALPHPFSPGERGVTLRSYLAMLNFKANHRKVFLADGEGGVTSIVTSANPHDGSSSHSNVAFAIRGGPWRDIHAAEQAVARLSGGRLEPPPALDAGAPLEPAGPTAEVRLLTEAKIRDRLLDLIGGSVAGDELWLAMFYLSERRIVAALLDASARGVRTRIILDPNRDAFGYEKNGIPNRPVARELVEKSEGRIEVRWYETRGEQFHAKMFFLDGADGVATAVLGSANLTRRNLDSYNLELDVEVSAPGGLPPMTEVRDWFGRLWANREGRFTAGYPAFADESPWKWALYRLQEASGLCSF